MTATMKPAISLTHFTNWLAYGERGLSSEAIVGHLTGSRVGRSYRARVDHPYDPSDFRRCQLLLEAHPLAALMFPQMRSASPEWARLVDAWDEIHEAIEREVPDYLNNGRGSAPLAYRLMKRVLDGGVKCEKCDGSGRAAPCSKCKGTARRSGGKCRASGCHQGFADCSLCRGYGYTRAVTA